MNRLNYTRLRARGSGLRLKRFRALGWGLRKAEPSAQNQESPFSRALSPEPRAAFPQSPEPPTLSQVSGFSLVELVISMAILSIGIVGAMRVFPVGLRASQRSQMRSRATIVAQRTIESLKLKAWEELGEGTTSAEQDEFEVATRVASVALEGLADPTRLKMIEVTVQWTEATRPRQLTFVTYVRRETS